MSGSNYKPSTSKKTYVDKDGKVVSDYIPNFISNTPWYVTATPLTSDSNIRKRKTDEERIDEIEGEDRLKHQRLNPDSEVVANNEPKKGLGIKDDFIAVEPDQDIGVSDLSKKEKAKWKRKIREWKKKGRCENCGGKHSKTDCLERPHTQSFLVNNYNGTKGSNSAVLIRKKEDQSWDVMRDRWHGYDVEKDYDNVVNELEKKEKMSVASYKSKNNITEDNQKSNDLIVKAIMESNPLKADDNYVGRSLDEKPRYLEVIKTGEELRYNPKSRVYKDLTKGFLNERGQFIPHLTGEAAAFEKMKKFTRTVQSRQMQEAQEDESSETAQANTDYTTEFSPTEVMLKMKEKEKNDELIREAKRKELLLKYGALDSLD